MNTCNGKSMVILDVDGVLNSYSNCRFYANYIYHSIKELSKIYGKKKLLKEFPKIRKAGGFNALFVFAKNFCGDDNTFKFYSRNLIKKLNFDLIPYDPSMKKMIERLSNYGDVCIRSDGLNDIASAVWKRIIENKSSAQIKIETFSEQDNNARHVTFKGKNVFISGIEDNNFKRKSDLQSWKVFSRKYQIDLSKSVLMDDSRDNTNIAKMLDMTPIHISKLDSALQNFHIGSVFHSSLSDILGKKVSKALSKYQISYGKKVDLKTLFKAILQTSSEKTSNNVKTSQVEKSRL